MNASVRPTKSKRRGDDPHELMVRIDAADALGDVGIPPGANYTDVFVLTGRFIEYQVDDWARALFEQAAGRTGQLLWRCVLRLQLLGPSRAGRVALLQRGNGVHLARNTPLNESTQVAEGLMDSDWVAGWRVAQRGEDWVRLVASGPLLSGNLVVRVEDQRVLLGTCVWYKTRFGGWLWRRLAPIHQRAAPDLLHDGLANLVAGN